MLPIVFPPESQVKGGGGGVEKQQFYALEDGEMLIPALQRCTDEVSLCCHVPHSLDHGKKTQSSCGSNRRPKR